MKILPGEISSGIFICVIWQIPYTNSVGYLGDNFYPEVKKPAIKEKFLIPLAFIQIASSKTALLERKVRQIAPNCGSLKFRCQNGQCIASDLLCDGRADCSDQSDETREECMRHEIVCPEYAFRCNYGACIDGDAPCNGIEDCVDKSDELLPRCQNYSFINGSASILPCTSSQFKCNNGQCVRSTAICDGTTDCIDRSDETSQLCGSIDCRPSTFRCNYGGCIDESLKCNGIFNCADGSDEDPNVCQDRQNAYGQPIGQPTTLEPPSRSDRPPCTIPPQPENGNWKLHKSQCQSGQHCDLRSHVKSLDPGTFLVYNCNEGHRLQGTGDVYCGPEGKWSSAPECSEIRCKPLSTVSTEADCTYNDDWISCEAPVPPRTIAKVSCRNSYRQELSILSTRRENVRCNSRGQWEPEPIRCSPVCGRITSKNKPLIVNGTRPNITEFPWHATLYRSETPDGEKQFICGATIIQSDLLITAAHCVYNEGTKSVEDPRLFAIATGNIFRDFNSRFHHPTIVKRANVKNIYAICNYLGREGNYARDIAILHIDQPFTFSALLMPACLDISTYSDQTVLEVGNYGKVAGFGRTATSGSSQILQTLSVPYVSLNECKASSVEADAEKYITIDKFCAGYRNGSSVCDGDSGGGLVFKSGGLWYLRGLVSVGIGATFSGGTKSCDSHAYALYTKISSHIEWIQSVILKLETFNEYLACPAKFSHHNTFD